MTDLHNDRVGNRGDVWKHFILCGVVDILLRERTDSQPFVYADTHCSLGHFNLGESGQWGQGIGQFYGLEWPLANHPYFVMAQKAYKANKSYLGSWKLVEGLLSDRKIQGDLRLFDTSSEVARQLSKISGFKSSDGFNAITSGLSAELYFVDPAYSEHRGADWRRVIKIAKQFSERNAKALIWYPVFIKERPIREITGVIIAEVRWPASGANQVMRGCGMVATGPVSGILNGMENSLVQLAEALSGKLCLRDQHN